MKDEVVLCNCPYCGVHLKFYLTKRMMKDVKKDRLKLKCRCNEVFCYSDLVEFQKEKVIFT